MSRSGYRYRDGDPEVMLSVYGWNANVRRCIVGRRGQAFMWELYHALHALPERVLITGGLQDQSGTCCSLGAVGRYRGMELPAKFCITDEGEPDDYEFQAAMGPLFGIKEMLAREVMFYNDEADDDAVCYAADLTDEQRKESGPWTPSIYMPREACRIVLEMMEMRVQRLQAISHVDARAEGWPGDDGVWPVDWYQSLWDAINGEGSYATNPLVWAITFRRIQ